ncbi:MAG: polysaccharide biosynthesis protein [Pyrinomonadaceae bacterium]|nr:polysaccharide biosynthesis protein [Pyrinomonadaceae bacterium]
MADKISTRDARRDTLWFFRRPLQFIFDVAILAGSFFLAYLLRFDFQLNDYYFDNALNQVPFVIFVQFAALFLSGSYSIIWRYVSLEDIKAFLKAAAISGVILVLVRLLLSPDQFIRWQVPLSIILMDTIFAFSGLLALRVLRRFAYEVREKRGFSGSRPAARRLPAFVIGAGRVGASLAKEMVGRADSELDIRGFIDDDRSKKGGSVGGVKVLGTTNDLARLIDEFSVERVVIAIDQARGQEIRRILDICQAIPVQAQIVPSLNEIAHGHVSVSRIRDVQIEDILGRDQVELDGKNLHDFLGEKTVMVTGAGGSIGSELARQITSYEPRELLLVERTEFLLFQITREMKREFPEVKCIPLVADVGDEPRMRQIFEKYKPAVIFHAAAHKHVPLMEANSTEAVKNNILATELIGKLAGEFGVNDFVLISTDKAVNPTSIMGASKRIAELVVQALDREHETNYVAVRFGNVLGSAGSVVPIFREQIQKGGPLTVTDKEMTRYFMTIPEASQLVLQAGAIGEGGEIFILDMGNPVKIVDLAEDMIRLSGLKPYEDIQIEFTGIREGEKLYEELEITGEDLLRTKHPKIFIGKLATASGEEVAKILSEFRKSLVLADEDTIREIFIKHVPESLMTTKESSKAKTSL